MSRLLAVEPSTRPRRRRAARGGVYRAAWSPVFESNFESKGCMICAAADEMSGEPLEWPTVTASRYSMDPPRVEQLVADYLAGDSLHVVAARYGRSYTWVRETLKRLGVPRRPRGVVPDPMPTEEIVRLRDDECLSWAEIRQITGLTEPALWASTERRRQRPSGSPIQSARRQHQRGNPPANDAVNHLDEIRDAYWSGTTLADLAEQWGVSARTISTWVYKGYLDGASVAQRGRD